MGLLPPIAPRRHYRKAADEELLPLIPPPRDEKIECVK